MTLLIIIVSFVLCVVFASRNAGAGVGIAILIGCMYGIVRANYFGVLMYFLFDLSVVGCYIGLLMNREFIKRPVPKDIRQWLTPMFLWPICLLPLEPNLLVSLVGLRSAVFFLPFVLIGARMNREELIIAVRFFALAAMIATGFAVAELAFGLRTFYPENDSTEIIYLSNDIVVGGQRFWRIPATFAHAAVYASTMVTLMPLVIFGIERDNYFFKFVSAIALICCVTGIFISTTRSGIVIVAAVIAYIFLRKPNLIFNRYVAFTIIIVGSITYSVVADNPRFSRFKTLGDSEVVTDRVTFFRSDLSLIDMAIEYPIGGGLAYTGVNIPKFIKRGRQVGIETENEYARIVGTQGVIGLILIIGFMSRCIVAGFRPHHLLSGLTRDASTGLLMMTLFSGFIGVGTYVAVPSACLLLLLLGILASSPPRQALEASEVLPQPSNR